MKKQQEVKVQPTSGRKPVEKAPTPRMSNPPKVQSELDRLMDMYAQL